MAIEEALVRKIAVLGYRGVGERRAPYPETWRHAPAGPFPPLWGHLGAHWADDASSTAPRPTTRRPGKSSLCARLVEDEYSPDYQPTIENTFSASLEFPEARVRFDCEIVDTAGAVRALACPGCGGLPQLTTGAAAQDEYSEMSRRASVGVHGYLLVFAVNSRASFEKLSIIHERLLEVVSDDRVPVVLVGNKVDALAERCVAEPSLAHRHASLAARRRRLHPAGGSRVRPPLTPSAHPSDLSGK